MLLDPILEGLLNGTRIRFSSPFAPVKAQAYPRGTEEGAGGPTGPPTQRGPVDGPKLRDWVERELGKRLSLYPV